MFYSETCPACRRFTPIWETTACSLKDKNIVFGHLEGNKNEGIVNLYSVSHTPTLALFNRVFFSSSFSFLLLTEQDLAKPIKYNGQKYLEAMIYFLKVMVSFCVLTSRAVLDTRILDLPPFISRMKWMPIVYVLFPANQALIHSSLSGEEMLTTTWSLPSTDFSPTQVAVL